jgi:hypothetical protein
MQTFHDDTELSSNNNMNPPPPSSPQAISSAVSASTSVSKCKISALGDGNSQSSAALTTTTSQSKKACTATGTVALNRIKDALNAFNATIQDTLTQPEPKRTDAEVASMVASKARVDAITHVQAEENHLSVDQVIALVDLFETNVPSVVTYIALVCKDVQAAWLKKKLVELGFPAKNNSWVQV